MIDDEVNKEIIEDAILKRLNILEEKILNYLNAELNIHLTGNEIKIDLNNKNIGNIELKSLSGLEFNNLEEINLRNNIISDSNILKEFN